MLKKLTQKIIMITMVVFFSICSIYIFPVAFAEEDDNTLSPSTGEVYIHELTTELFQGASPTGSFRETDDKNYLWTATNSQSGHSFCYRINYSVSGENELNPGEFSIDIPLHVIRNEVGKWADKYIMTLPSREQYDQGVRDKTDDFLCYEETDTNDDGEMDTIHIYNAAPAPSALNGYIEVAYSTTERTWRYTDHTQLTDFQALLKERNESQTSNICSASIDTSASMRDTWFEDVQPTVYESWNPSWGTSVKPDVASDYMYVVWNLCVDVNGDPSQNYTLTYDPQVSGSAGPAEVVAMSFEGTDWTTNYIRNNCTGGGYKYYRILTKMKKSDYKNIDDWKLSCNVSVTLHPEDGFDPDTSGTAYKQMVYSMPQFSAPGSSYSIYQHGNGGWYGDHWRDGGSAHYSTWDGTRGRTYEYYDLQKFKNGDVDEISDIRFYSHGSYYTYPLTIKEGGSADNPEDYGYKSSTMTLESGNIYIGSEIKEGDEPLTPDDIEINSVRFNLKSTDAEYNEDKKRFETHTVNGREDTQVYNIYVKYGDSDEWALSATWTAATKTGTVLDDRIENISNNTITFKDDSHATAWKFETENSFYSTSMEAMTYLTLKNSDRIMEAVKDKNLFCLSMPDHGEVVQDGNEIYSATACDFDRLIVTQRESSISKLVTGTSNDVANKRYIIYWGISMDETIVTGSGGREYIQQNGGTFYDLLPEGSTFDRDSVTVTADGVTLNKTDYTLTTTLNYKGSNRILLKIQIKKPANIYKFYYATANGWDSIIDYGTYKLNPVAYQTGNNDIAGGYYDDPKKPKSSTQGNALKSEIDRKWFTDLGNDGNNNEARFIYTNCAKDISILTSATAGLTKKVLGGVDSSDSEYTYSTTTSIDRVYSYRLRYQNSFTSSATNLIFFDSLENFFLTDGTESQWHGTLDSVGLDQMENKGVMPRVFISEVENLDLDEHHDLTDTSIWKEVDLSGDLSSAKAIAIDARKRVDGTPYVLPKGESISAYLYMKAPEEAPSADGTYPESYNNIYIMDTLVDTETGESQDYWIHQDYTTIKLAVTGDLLLHKVSAKDPDVPAKNVEFRLIGTSDYGNDVDIIQATDSSGYLTFADIEMGEYKLTEYNSTSEWIMDYTARTVRIDSFGKVTVDGVPADNGITLTNQPRVHSDIVFNKRDIANTNRIVMGARFKLSGVSEYGNNVVMYAESEANGQVLFPNVEQGAYTLTEISPAEGWITSNNIYDVLVDENGQVFFNLQSGKVDFFTNLSDGSTAILNEKYHQFSIFKQNNYNYAAVPGVTFRLYGTSSYGTQVDRSLTTSENGIVIFDNLESGSYILEETSVENEGDIKVELDTTKRIVSVGRDGTITIDGLEAQDDMFTITDIAKNSQKVTVIKKWVDPEGSDIDHSQDLPQLHISGKDPSQEDDSTSAIIPDISSLFFTPVHAETIPVETEDSSLNQITFHHGGIYGSQYTSTLSTPTNNPLINLCDGNTSSYWYSNSAQSAGKYLQLDLQNIVPFSTIALIGSTASGDYCSNADVLISDDGENWINIGKYTETDSWTYISLPEDHLQARYIKIQIATAKSNWWRLAEFRIGTMDNGDFVQMSKHGFGGINTENVMKYDSDGNLVSGEYIQPANSDTSTFAGWALSENGEVVYTTQDEIPIDSDLDLYAIYNVKAHTTFDANGTKFSDGLTINHMYWDLNSINTVENEGTYKRPVSPVGKGFAGWSLTSDGDVEYLNQTDLAKDRDLYLYAIYGDWYYDWTYVLDNTNKYIILRAYNGLLTDYQIPAKATIDGVTYRTCLRNYNGAMNCGTIQTLTLEEGVILGANCTNLFQNNNNLVSIDMTGADSTSTTNMQGMFANMKLLEKITLGTLDSSMVTNVSYMFYKDPVLTEINGLSLLNTSKATTMAYMFQDSPKLTYLDLTTFDTSNVSTMAQMFYNCSGLQYLNVSSFNTSRVTSFAGMFYGCSSLNELDVSGFDTAKATTLRTMFYNCQSLQEIDISGFNTSNCTDMGYMFYSCSSVKSLDLSNLDMGKVKTVQQMFNKCSSLTQIDLSSFNTALTTNFNGMLANCTSLTEIDTSVMDTGSATDLSSLFSGDTALIKVKLPVDTSKVTTMEAMFNGCSSLSDLDLSPMDTSKVKNFNSMFQSMKALKHLDVSSMDTSSGVDFGYMFHVTGLVELDLSNFNTSNATSLFRMFMESYDLKKVNVSSFDTQKVTNMNGVFWDCESLEELDLKNWYTPKVSDFTNFCINCSKLKSVDVSSMVTDRAGSLTQMFAYCYELKELSIGQFKTTSMSQAWRMLYQDRKLEKLDISNFEARGNTWDLLVGAPIKAIKLGANTRLYNYFSLSAPSNNSTYTGKWTYGSPYNHVDTMTHSQMLAYDGTNPGWYYWEKRGEDPANQTYESSENVFSPVFDEKGNLVKTAEEEFSEDGYWQKIDDKTYAYTFYVVNANIPWYVWEDDVEGYVGDATIDSPAYIASSSETAVITNTTTQIAEQKYGDLKIAKETVNEPYEMDYHFTVELINEEGAAPSGTILYGTVPFVDGIADISLKSGESIEISDIPVGYTYQVTEIPPAGVECIAESTNATGSIEEDVTSLVSFRNTFEDNIVPEHYGSFSLEKTVQGEGSEYLNNQEFVFDIALEGLTFGQTYYMTAEDRTVEIIPKQDGSASISLSLKHGERAVSSQLPEGTQFMISERSNSCIASYTVSSNGLVEKSKGSNSEANQDLSTAMESIEADEISNVKFVNQTCFSKDLVISKQVVSSIGEIDTGRPFSFLIGFSNLNPGQTIETDQVGQLKASSNGTASTAVTINHGNSVRFKGVPVGVSYQITELNSVGYEASAKVNGDTVSTTKDDTGSTISGTLQPSEIDEELVEWTNTYTPEFSLTIKKQVTGNSGDKSESFDFSVHFNPDDAGRVLKTMRNGTEEKDIAVPDDGIVRFSLSHNETLAFEGLTSEDVRYAIAQETGSEVDINDETINSSSLGVSESDYSDQGYTTTSKSSYTNANKSVVVTYINNRECGVPTGYHIPFGPSLIVISVLAASVYICVFVKKS